MSNIALPEKKNKSKSLFQVGGAVVGTIFGGPAGGAAGYQAGGMVADMNHKPGPSEGAPGGTDSAPTGDAMARRSEASNPQGDLRNAQAASAQMPAADQKKVGPILRRAQMLSEQDRTA